MNTKDNQKFNETEKKIRDAFFKIIDGNEAKQVEISKICEVAKIHRTTFYGHYSDIYDLTNVLAKEYIFDKCDAFMKEDNRMLLFLNYIKDNQSFFKYYYLSGLSHMEKDFMSEKMLCQLAITLDLLVQKTKLKAIIMRCSIVMASLLLSKGGFIVDVKKNLRSFLKLLLIISKGLKIQDENVARNRTLQV